MQNFRKCAGLRNFGLYPYQLDWAEDESRFKIALWARQTGKDFSATAEAVYDSMVNPRSTWIVLAASERQALESIEKAKDWARIMQFMVDDYEEQREPGRAGGRLNRSCSLLKSAEIEWINGSRFLALPAKPETVRGFSANLILTEFAFHEDPEGIWRAIYPSIANPLRGGEKKLRIISTPNGLGNKFAELWHNPGNYARHFTTIHDAVAAGLNVDIAALRSGLNDPEAWAQEFECQFVDTHSVLLSYDLIQSCESEEASEQSSAQELSTRSGKGLGPLYLGIDFGRKQHLTVAWTLQKHGKEWVTREVLALKNLSTPEQVEILAPRIALAARASLDFTGAGIGMGDYLVKRFGEWNPEAQRGGKVELCQFTAKLKGEVFPRLKTAFENRELKIPISREIREDLHAIHRVVSPNGQVSYRSSQSGDGHSDRCTALALAWRAARAGAGSVKAESFDVSDRGPRLGWARERLLPK